MFVYDCPWLGEDKLPGRMKNTILSNVFVNHAALKKVLIGFLGSKRFIKPVLHMNFSENASGSISDVTKCFLNDISGTVAVITSDGRMIVVRLIFFNILFSPIRTSYHGGKEALLG